MDRVIYVGNFMKGNDLSKRFLSYAMNFWSKGTRRAYFIRHEVCVGETGTKEKREGGGGGGCSEIVEGCYDPITIAKSRTGIPWSMRRTGGELERADSRGLRLNSARY